ncbi:MAG: Crp/Fnr family transcriptional regulator [Bacilli bacterium]|nr:Crp/Fnr family transcriptional regulator [Bacilli bacterium]
MEYIEKLLESYKDKIRSYKKGMYIAREGERCSFIGIVIEGYIKISSISSNGDEIFYKHLYSEDMFGNNLLFSSNPVYKGDVVTMEDTRVFLFDKETFLNLLTTDKEFLESFLFYQSEDAKRLNQTVKLLSMDKAEDRLFYLLRHNRNGLKFKNMSTLALQLGLTRESTSRLVHRLLREGQIYIVDNLIF